jgi:aminoglycoside 3-N-acetyltransferase
MYSRAELAAGFRSLGVMPGDVVMLHASVRAVGPIAGGPDEIHLALEDALGPAGTILMYAGCPRYVDEIGRGNLGAEVEREVQEKLPAFDPATARAARDNGALVELFRTWPGTRFNRHPTRFVARGAAAESLLADGPWDFAFGHGSVFERLLALDGRILLLGSDHDNVTFLHYAEHVVDVPDKRIARFLVPVMEGDVRVWRPMLEVDSAERAHENWPDRFFARLVDGFLAATGNRGRNVGDAPSVLFPARGLLDHALPIMRAVAMNAETASALPLRSAEPGRRA